MLPNNQWVAVFQVRCDVEIYSLSLWESKAGCLLIQHRFFRNHADAVNFSLDR